MTACSTGRGGTIIKGVDRTSNNDGRGAGFKATILVTSRWRSRCSCVASFATTWDTLIMELTGNTKRTGIVVQTGGRVVIGIRRIGVTVDTVITSSGIIPVRCTGSMATEAVVGAGGTGIAIEAVAGTAVTEINIGFSWQSIAHIGNIGGMIYAAVRRTDMRQRARCLRITGLVTIDAGLTCRHSVSIVLGICRRITMTSVTAEAVDITPGTVGARD